MTLRLSNKVTVLAEQKKITGEGLRRVRRSGEVAKETLELYRTLRIVPFASMENLDLSDPDMPRWRPFPEGRYVFRVDYLPAAKEYLLDLHCNGAGPALWPPPEADGPEGDEVDCGDHSRVRSLAFDRRSTSNVTVLSGAFVRIVRDSLERVGQSVHDHWDGCRWVLRLAAATARFARLTPQNVAPELVSRLRRETVRISESFRMELAKPISASPLGLWQPDMYGEPQLDIGRLFT